MQVIRLTTFNEILTNKMFSDPIECRVPGKDVTFRKFKLQIKHDNDKFGLILVKTERCLNFGVQQNYDRKTGEVTGYSLPIVMYDSPPTSQQKEWVEGFYKVVECFKEHLALNYEFASYEMGNIASCMWWSDNKVMGPTLYAKIATTRDKRNSSKFQLDGITVQKEELTENYNVTSVIHFDSINVYEGNVFLQVKVYEAALEELKERESLLS